MDWVKGEYGLGKGRVWTVYRESMDCVQGEYGLYRESMDWVKGKYGLCIGRVWTVQGEYGLGKG